MSVVVNATGKVVSFVDDRITINNWLRRNLRKVFPDHWTFLLGEIALVQAIECRGLLQRRVHPVARREDVGSVCLHAGPVL